MQVGSLFVLSVLETIGNIPLVKVGRIYAKIEITNLIGSIKDRLALYFIYGEE